MTTTSQLISTLRGLDDCEMELAYIPPVLHLMVTSQLFQDRDTNSRMALLLRRLSVAGFRDEDVSHLLRAAPIAIDCFEPDESAEKDLLKRRASATAPSSWVSWFEGTIHLDGDTREQPAHKFVHFYGYKGGQGRSSVMALLAQSLANDGYRVLALDADVEAPSLDYLLGARADDHSQTLMGLCGWATDIRPIAGVYSGTRGGRVDLIACRSRQEEFDLDFALFVATSPLDTRVLEAAAIKLHSYLDKYQYDVVLIDHRTGMAPSVLPLMRRLTGPTAIFARPDANVGILPSDLLKVCRAILFSGVAAESFFVNFSLDPNKAKLEATDSAEAAWRETLSNELEMAAYNWSEHDDQSDTASSFDIDDEETSMIEFEDIDQAELIYSPVEMSYRWINWYLDRSLLGSAPPDVSRLQTDNLESIGRIREVLNLGASKRSAHRPMADYKFYEVHTSLSGARDHGLFVQIPEVERLLVPLSPYTYVLGRKGTGKTRLLHEMANRRLGRPLLVASDEGTVGGLQSGSVEASALLDRCDRDPDRFWWTLLGIALDSGASNHSLKEKVGEVLESNLLSTYSDKLALRRRVQALSQPEVFLIDGLETMVPASESREFVAALFRLLAAIQNDPSFTANLTLRLFIREDLAAGAVQNVEQQMDGRLIQLRWSAASILNFALSRIPTLPWIRGQFKQLCTKIVSGDVGEEIAYGSLAEQDAVELLLQMLPERMRRNNLSTKTFLKLYFSDAGGDETNKAAFYPRLYTSFLGKLDRICAAHKAPLDADGRIDSKLVNLAYDEAAREFIAETKLELVYLLTLTAASAPSSYEDDTARLDRFISAFEGMSTPFEYEEAIKYLANKTGFTEPSIRAALLKMKSIRMFEDRPGFSGWWRVGQLFKMGLRMKYTR